MVFSRGGLLYRDPLQLPAVSRAAGKYGPDNARLGHADAVPGDIDGGAGFKFVVAGGEGVPAVLPALEGGMTEVLRAPEELAEGLGQPVVLLDEGLVVYLPQKGSAVFVLGRGGDEMRPGLAVKALLVGEHPVPDVPAAAEGLFKQLRLLRRRVETGLDGAVPYYPALAGGPGRAGFPCHVPTPWLV